MSQAYYGLLIGGLWLAWVIYWSFAAGRVKPVFRAEDHRSRRIYAIPQLAGFVLILAPGALGSALNGQIFPRVQPLFMAAIVLVVLGLSFSAWARRHLADNWSAQVAVKEGHELIRSGPYALVRHPIYTGVLVAILGSTVIMNRPQTWIGYVLVAASFVIKLRAEERIMEGQFGEDYRLYKKQVAALIPGLF